MAEVTVVITPRDRFTGIEDCIENVYRCTPEPFKLIVVDAGYPGDLRRGIERAIKGKANAEIADFGLVIPMESMARVRSRIDTTYVMFLDNDSDVTPGWLPPLLETAGETGAAIISPLTLERAGVDFGENLRCHLYTSDIRSVDVDGTPYLIENKHYRRTPHRDIPVEVRDSESFELHGVMFETATLMAIDIPHATIREHLDISMQVKAMGRRQVVDSRSVVEFDNLGKRAALHDLKYFNYRWGDEIMRQSSDLFLERWGYRWYSEQHLYNWAIRRRMFLVAHHYHCPTALANKVALGYQKFFLKNWEPLKDPVGDSVHFYSTLPGGIPHRIDVPEARSAERRSSESLLAV